MNLLKILRLLVALPVCAAALLLPYRARVLYGRAVAFLVHLPFLAFGRLARLLMKSLDPRGARAA